MMKGKLGGWFEPVMLAIAAMAVVIRQIYLLGLPYPMEDAAMLMRYAENFANGHGIVWNVGEPPCDGGTDFLLIILIGLLVKVGLSLEVATRGIIIAAHVGSVIFVYLFLRSVWSTSRLPAIFSAMLLILGPARFQIAAYFGAPVFALAGLLTWGVAIIMMRMGITQIRAFLFSLLCLISALIRPEGSWLALLMTAALIYHSGWKGSIPVLKWLGILFLFVGGIYFIWRWNYFGQPFPNVVYKKGTLHWSGLKSSIIITFHLLLPLLYFCIASLFVGYWGKETIKWVIINLIPIAGFVGMFLFVSPEMNFAGRFQYIILPLFLISYWPLAERLFSGSLWGRSEISTRLRLMIAIGFVLATYYYQIGLNFSSSEFSRDGRYDIARILSEYKGDFTLATTEAGLLPLYSRWRSLDTWGLNDQWIARHGVITEKYLDQFKPHVVQMKASYKPLNDHRFRGESKWAQMLNVIYHYVTKNRYILAAAFGPSPDKVHYYFVRPDFPESEEIVQKIRQTEYFWLGVKTPAIDWAKVFPNR